MNEILLTPGAKSGWVMQALNIKKLRYSSAVLLGDDLFIVGGFDWNGWVSSIRKFNESTQSLTTWNIPQVYQRALGYMRDDSVMGFYSEYSTTTKYLWSKDSPSAASGSGTMSNYQYGRAAVGYYINGVKAAANRRTYFFGGNNNATQLHELNHSTAAWGLIRSDVRIHGAYPAACEVGGNMYVFGGLSTTIATNYATKYNPSTNTLTNLANMPAAKYGAAAIAIDADTIHVIGGLGNSESNPTFDSIYEYKISTNTWKVLPEKFLYPILFPGYVQNEKAAYIVGSNETNETSADSSRIFKLTF